MSEKPTMVPFLADDGTEVMLEVIAQTTVDGKEYLLVNDSEEDCAVILRASAKDDEGITYDLVDDDDEIDAVVEAFGEFEDDFSISVEE
ncbi:MAG: DUF1292 domain-containing protein [Lachnospiraceae bacterium]|nr:DUF1292 domain-containing protein [Lachnospiraceae bacterium]